MYDLHILLGYMQLIHVCELTEFDDDRKHK